LDEGCIYRGWDAFYLIDEIQYLFILKIKIYSNVEKGENNGHSQISNIERMAKKAYLTVNEKNGETVC
jgi:hypothetical protein